MAERKDVLDELYYGNINESERWLGKIAETEEYKKYCESTDKLIATFPRSNNNYSTNFFSLRADTRAYV